MLNETQFCKRADECLFYLLGVSGNSGGILFHDFKFRSFMGPVMGKKI